MMYIFIVFVPLYSRNETRCIYPLMNSLYNNNTDTNDDDDDIREALSTFCDYIVVRSGFLELRKSSFRC